MVHFYGIWNDFELQRKKQKKTIWNDNLEIREFGEIRVHSVTMCYDVLTCWPADNFLKQ